MSKGADIPKVVFQESNLTLGYENRSARASVGVQGHNSFVYTIDLRHFVRPMGGSLKKMSVQVLVDSIEIFGNDYSVSKIENREYILIGSECHLGSGRQGKIEIRIRAHLSEKYKEDFLQQYCFTFEYSRKEAANVHHFIRLPSSHRGPVTHRSVLPQAARQPPLHSQIGSDRQGSTWRPIAQVRQPETEVLSGTEARTTPAAKLSAAANQEPESEKEAGLAATSLPGVFLDPRTQEGTSGAIAEAQASGAVAVVATSEAAREGSPIRSPEATGGHAATEQMTVDQREPKEAARLANSDDDDVVLSAVKLSGKPKSICVKEEKVGASNSSTTPSSLCKNEEALSPEHDLVAPLTTSISPPCRQFASLEVKKESTYKQQAEDARFQLAIVEAQLKEYQRLEAEEEEKRLLAEKQELEEVSARLKSAQEKLNSFKRKRQHLD